MPQTFSRWEDKEKLVDLYGLEEVTSNSCQEDAYGNLVCNNSPHPKENDGFKLGIFLIERRISKKL